MINVEQYYDRSAGKTNLFNKVNLLRKAKKGAIYLCGDKLGIATNVISFSYLGLKAMGLL